MPILDGRHYFVYCFNFIHGRIDILDSNDYVKLCTDPCFRHKPVWDHLNLIDEAFQKVSKNKIPRVHRWPKPFVDLPKQARDNDCLFFLWKYLEFYDGERLTVIINPVSILVLLHSSFSPI